MQMVSNLFVNLETAVSRFSMRTISRRKFWAKRARLRDKWPVHGALIWIRMEIFTWQIQRTIACKNLCEEPRNELPIRQSTLSVAARASDDVGDVVRVEI